MVLASANGPPVQHAAQEVQVSRPMAWRWQQGPDGLLHDKSRKPGKPPIASETIARVVALTYGALRPV